MIIREWKGFVKSELNELLSSLSIIDIKCGSNHSIGLTDSGEVYGWGPDNCEDDENKYGKYQSTSIKINGFNDEKAITMKYHVFILI